MRSDKMSSPPPKKKSFRLEEKNGRLDNVLNPPIMQQEIWEFRVDSVGGKILLTS